MLSSKHTIGFSCVGFFTQAITINVAPLLFVTFENEFNISLFKISVLIAISFATQFSMDFIAAKFSNIIKPRATAIFAHTCAAVGMISYSFLPDLIPDPYIGLLIATVLASMGAGLLEVVLSPIVEACPTKKKSATMSLLHSFYSWGIAGTVLLSTIFFEFFGIEHWRILTSFWGLVPMIGAIGFCFVPIYVPKEDDQKSVEGTSLFKTPLLWIFMMIMFCAGAAEQAVSQWTSSFAETGLGVSKATGDLLGLFAFAVLMGASRIFYTFFSKKIKLRTYMALSSVLCIISYLMAALSPIPVISLLGCAICGLSVGIMWPGTYSLAAKKLPECGVRMFAILALAGDLGCLIGPTGAGWIASLFGDDLKAAFLFATIFPTIMLFLIRFTKNEKNKLEIRGHKNGSW